MLSAMQHVIEKIQRHEERYKCLPKFLRISDSTHEKLMFELAFLEQAAAIEAMEKPVSDNVIHLRSSVMGVTIVSSRKRKSIRGKI
jgi:hypothetical protein